MHIHTETRTQTHAVTAGHPGPWQAPLSQLKHCDPCDQGKSPNLDEFVHANTSHFL